MKRLLAVLVFALLLIPGVTQAQIQPNSWFVVLNVNYNVATIRDFGETVNGLGAGVQFDRVLGGNGAVSLGITANYVNVDGNSTVAVQGPSGPESLSYSAKTQGAPIAVYVRYLFGGSGIRGYVGVGPGMFVGETTVQEVGQPATTGSSTKFAGMAMAGGMFKMGNTVWLNAGVSLFLVPGSADSILPTVEPETGTVDIYSEYTWAGTLGIVIPLGNP